MPTYEYACKQCGEHVEVVQSFRDDPLTTCANCGGPLRKVFGAIGIAFKGSGFYRTDSRDSGSRSKREPKEVAATAPSTESGPAAPSPSPPPPSSSGTGDSKAAAST